MFTQQEAADKYNYYFNLYQEARNEKDKANNMLDESSKQKRENESQLSKCKEQKKNLEERLVGVKNIISFFLHDITQHINKANRSAVSAGEKYTAAIRCDTITSTSIGSAFHSKTIDEDTRMLAPAYQNCNNEKERLERDIESLNKQTAQFNAAISLLESDIRRYRRIVSNAEEYMNIYKARVSYYEPYM